MKLLIIAMLSTNAFAHKIDTHLVEYIRASAVEAGVDPATALAVVDQESSFNPKAKRPEPKYHTFSVGLFQMFIPTARYMGFKGPIKKLYDVAVNTKLGIAHLKACTKRFGNDTERVICCHNAGIGVKESFCDTYAWTARYVKDVMAKKPKWDAYLSPSPGVVLACIP